VNNSLALTMIVKDEEKNLRRCLDSVVELVDEIVIVDTGSTDATKEIAATYQDKLSGELKILDFEWCNDFSAARNYAIDNTASDWILALDADEELVKGADNLKFLMGDKTVDAYYVRLVEALDYESASEGGEAFVAYRMFRNREDIRYHYPLYERVTVDGPKVSNCDLVIVHFGPLMEWFDPDERADRNVAVLEAALDEDDKNGFLLSSLGTEFFQAEMFTEAYNAYRESMNYTSQEDFHAPGTLRNMAWCLYQLKQADEAKDLLKHAQSAFSDYTDLFYLEGDIALQEDRNADAVAAFRHCLELGDPSIRYVTLGGTGSWLAQKGLGEAEARLREPTG